MKHDFIRDREQLAPWTSWLQPLPPLQSSPLHDAQGQACKRHIGVCASSNKVFFLVLLQIFNSSTNLQCFNSFPLLPFPDLSRACASLAQTKTGLSCQSQLSRGLGHPLLSPVAVGQDHRRVLDRKALAGCFGDTTSKHGAFAMSCT